MSIKISDLRIGNWVSLFKGVTDEGGEWKQYQIDSGHDLYKLDENDCADISGIPLTEDWLIRFGFTKIPNSQFVQFWNKENITIWHRYDIEPNEFAPAYDKLDQLEFLYVHQLQNLYFALTGTELTLTE